MIRRLALCAVLLVFAMPLVGFSGNSSSASDIEATREKITISHCEFSGDILIPYQSPFRKHADQCALLSHEVRSIAELIEFDGSEHEEGVFLVHAGRPASEIAFLVEAIVVPKAYNKRSEKGVLVTVLIESFRMNFRTDYSFPIYSPTISCVVDCRISLPIEIYFEGRFEADISDSWHPEWEQIIARSVSERTPIRIHGSLRLPNKQPTLGALVRELQKLRMTVTSLGEIDAATVTEPAN